MMQILFLGAPGAGKGTQCARLAKHLNLIHLSSGDLLRQAVKAGTPTGLAAKSYMDKGQLVPDEVLIAMFRDKLTQQECDRGFILDGFPRTVVQAEALDKLLEELNKNLTVVVNVQVNPNLLLERITGRRTCSNKECGATYHVKFVPPKKENVCDLCSSELIQRSDDKEDVVAQRLSVYEKQTAPLINYYDKNLSLRTIDGDGEVEEIFADILKTIKVLA
ncbi:MAG: adenylate kinase [Candidatus Obscuribacterales bacterium]|nr:adenylate kinase [Candidatus Obscuribacterales bacterium]